MIILKRIILSFIVFSLLIVYGTQASAAWPEKLQATVEQAKTSLEDVWALPPRMTDEIEKHGIKFDQALDAIAKQLPSDMIEEAHANEASDIHAKLIAIALYRRDYRARIDEIIKHFTEFDQNLQPSRAVARPPAMSGNWAKPDDRLAWEYILLRPGVSRDVFFMQRIRDALSLIGDPASVLTVTTSFRTTLTEKALPYKNRHRYQKQLIEMLAHMPNTKSLEALMNIEIWIKSAPEYVDKKAPPAPWRPTNKDLIGFPATALRSYISDKEKEKWKVIFEDVPSHVSPNDSKILKKLKRNLEKKR